MCIYQSQIHDGILDNHKIGEELIIYDWWVDLNLNFFPPWHQVPIKSQPLINFSVHTLTSVLASTDLVVPLGHVVNLYCPQADSY